MDKASLTRTIQIWLFMCGSAALWTTASTLQARITIPPVDGNTNRSNAVNILDQVRHNADFKTKNCSLFDLSNGTLCECGSALSQQCGATRGSDGCTTCAKSVTNCDAQTKSQFCNGGCSPSLDFTWVDDIPANPKNLSIVIQDMVGFCKGNSSSLEEGASRAMTEMDLELLQVFGCNEYVLYAYAIGMGFEVFDFTNQTIFNNDHENINLFLTSCCLEYETDPHHCLGTGKGRGLKSFFALLKKATDGCQRDLVQKEIEAFGLDDPDIEPGNPFGSALAIDLRKLSSLLKPLVIYAFDDIYGATLRYLPGLTFAATTKHDCGHSWFVPGADHLYADTFKIQGDFYFPSMEPSPFESQGTCGMSSLSEKVRLSACEGVTRYLYDNARISGMSIIGCAVDCTASRLDHVPGSFVAVSVGVVEIDTTAFGFGDKNGGLNASIGALNTEGLNLTNDVKATVGIGYRFTVHHISSEDIISQVNWSSKMSNTDTFTTETLFPNMTQAMLAYKAPNSSNTTKVDNTSWKVILIATVVPVLLLGVLIGLFLRFKKRGQADLEGVELAPAGEYEDDETE